MPLRKNARLTTARRALDPVTRSTSVALPYLRGIACHIGPNGASAFGSLPDGAVKSPYVASIDPGVDIAEGDLITAITRLNGVTPWPGDYPAARTSATSQDPTSQWEVTFHQDSDPGLRPYRRLFITRYTGGGKPHP